jgi:hypothetical protein
MVSTSPYSEILKESKKERKKKFQQSTLYAFSKKMQDPQPGASSWKSNLCITPQSKMINRGALQWRLQKLSVCVLNISE